MPNRLLYFLIRKPILQLFFFLFSYKHKTKRCKIPPHPTCRPMTGGGGHPSQRRNVQVTLTKLGRETWVFPVETGFDSDNHLTPQLLPSLIF